MSARDGGQAFPRTTHQSSVEGMTLRDYFAASHQANPNALRSFAEAVVGRPMPEWQTDLAGYCLFWDTYNATRAYQHADAMLKASEAPPC